MDNEQLGGQAKNVVTDMISKALKKQEQEQEQLKELGKQTTVGAAKQEIGKQIGKVATPHIKKAVDKIKEGFDDKIKPIVSGKIGGPSGPKPPKIDLGR